MKKILPILLSLILAFSLSVTSFAALPSTSTPQTNPSNQTTTTPQSTPAVGSDSLYLNQLNEKEAAVYQTILSNFNSFTTSFFHELSPAVPVNDSGKALTNIAYRAYEAVYRDHPEVFWVPKAGGLKISLSMTDSAPDQEATRINLSVSMGSANDINKKKAAMEAALTKILQAAPTNVYDRIKYFHDTIIAGCEYDTPAKNNPNAFPESYEAYGALVNNKAVCEGYAKAFKILCDRSGIPCVLVGGTAKNQPHMWNYVMIDGKYYLVDCTFDDPVGGSPTTDNFLKGADTSSGYSPTGSFLQGFDSKFQNPTLNPTAFDTATGKGGTATTIPTPAANTTPSGTTAVPDVTPPAEPKQASPTSADPGKYFTINYGQGEGGYYTVSYTGGTGAVDRGQIVLGGVCLSVNAYPNEGYKVSEIKADMGSTPASIKDHDVLNFSVIDNCNISVTFVKG